MPASFHVQILKRQTKSFAGRIGFHFHVILSRRSSGNINASALEKKRSTLANAQSQRVPGGC
jgi:hypothetical protein